MVLIDTHCHLVTDDFDIDREEVISRMIAKGVSRAVVICCDEDESRLGALLRDIIPGSGLHAEYIRRIWNTTVHPSVLRDSETPSRDIKQI